MGQAASMHQRESAATKCAPPLRRGLRAKGEAEPAAFCLTLFLPDRKRASRMRIQVDHARHLDDLLAFLRKNGCIALRAERTRAHGSPAGVRKRSGGATRTRRLPQDLAHDASRRQSDARRLICPNPPRAQQVPRALRYLSRKCSLALPWGAQSLSGSACWSNLLADLLTDRFDHPERVVDRLLNVYDRHHLPDPEPATVPVVNVSPTVQFGTMVLIADLVDQQGSPRARWTSCACSHAGSRRKRSPRAS